MGLETGTYISDLVSTNPVAADPKSQGDDHLRLIKATVKATFPNISGAVTPTHTELNYVDGVTSAIQTQIDTKGAIAGQTWTGTHVFPSTTSIGNVSDTEISYLDGVTSAVQTQLNTLTSAKGAIAGQTWTGTHDYTGATLQAATQTAGDSSTKVATTAFVGATAFSAALPSQTGNSGKFVTTDGSNASWALPIADQTSNSGKYLTTNGTTTSWASVPTPGLVFISTATASSVATVDITGINSTYSEYLLVCTAVFPDTDNKYLYLRTSTNGGSSFDSGASDYKWTVIGRDDATSTLGSASTADTKIQIPCARIGSASSCGMSCQIRIHKPSASNYTQITWDGMSVGISGSICSMLGAAQRISTNDVDAIRLYFETGNIASGEFKLYGLRAS